MNTDLLLFLFFLTPALVTLIWPVRTLFTAKPVLACQWLLAFVQVLSALALVTYAALYYNIINDKCLADVIYTLISLFIYPTFYMYICSLTNAEGVTRRERQIAFLPPLIYSLLFIVDVFYIGEETYSLYASNALIDNNHSFMPSRSYNMMLILGYWGFDLLIVLQVFGFLTASYFKLRKYRLDLIAFNPILRRKYRSAYWASGLVFISTVVMYGIIFNHNPKTVSSMGLLYVLLLIYAGTQYLLGQAGYHLDFTARQMSVQKHLQDQSSNQIGEEK